MEFNDLAPPTRYVYRVGDGSNWSEWIQFRTASTDSGPFAFVYFGDAQNNLKSHWSRVVREAYRGTPEAAFLLHAGDLVDCANSDAQWGEWFDAGGFIHRMTPCIAAPGNHEYAGELSRHWRATFAFPEHGPDGLEQTVYFIDYQGARIIILNSNDRLQDQADWLETVLAESKERWTIVSFHHPIYSSAQGRDNPELRDRWQPVFDRFGVDLVLQGHDHTYARTKMMIHEDLGTRAWSRSAGAGTVYVISVSGPKMYPVDKRPFMSRTAQGTQLYQIITIDGDQLHYEARTVTGRRHDAFTLRKRVGQSNQLVEQFSTSQ